MPLFKHNSNHTARESLSSLSYMPVSQTLSDSWLCMLRSSWCWCLRLTNNLVSRCSLLTKLTKVQHQHSILMYPVSFSLCPCDGLRHHPFLSDDLVWGYTLSLAVTCLPCLTWKQFSVFLGLNIFGNRPVFGRPVSSSASLDVCFVSPCLFFVLHPLRWRHSALLSLVMFILSTHCAVSPLES